MIDPKYCRAAVHEHPYGLRQCLRSVKSPNKYCSKHLQRNLAAALHESDAQDEEIKRLQSECELNRNCKLAVVIAKDRMAEQGTKIERLQSRIELLESDDIVLKRLLGEIIGIAHSWNRELSDHEVRLVCESANAVEDKPRHQNIVCPECRLQPIAPFGEWTRMSCYCGHVINNPEVAAEDKP